MGAPLLAAQQRNLLTALLAGNPSSDDPSYVAALAGIRGGELTAAERLQIYRNNLRENFLKVLALEFPVIERLVGADFFRQTGRQYLEQAPSRSGDLFHVGRRFAAFLRQQFGATEYGYLPDVAELEWDCQQVMIAADDARIFDIAGLAALDQDQYDRLRLHPHPALRIVRSPFPIVAIWRANQPDDGAEPAANDTPIDLDRGGENALVHRPLRSTGIESISNGAAEFLAAVMAHQPLGLALEAAADLDAGFDLESSLGPWIQERIFVSWSLA